MILKVVFLLGNGCRNNPRFVENLTSFGIPILTTWMGIDLLPEGSSVFCGRPGLSGQRAANIIIQKADVLICLGARLDNEQIAYNYENLAPNAHKIIYDVDDAELNKLPKSWEKHKVDLDKFHFLDIIDGWQQHKWLEWCKDLYKRFRSELDGHYNHGYDNPDFFISILSGSCNPDDVFAIGSSGGAPISFLQGFKVQHGQRIFNCSTIGAMGADIPMAIGACLAFGGRRTICVTGDGGFMLNVQELALVKRYDLPIKFFVYNNNGYGSIRAMQDARFEGRHVGCDPESGLSLPRIKDIAQAFGIAYYDKLSDGLGKYSMFEQPHPQICELFIDPKYKQLPRVLSSMGADGQFHPDALENTTPKLDPKELDELMSWGN